MQPFLIHMIFFSVMRLKTSQIHIIWAVGDFHQESCSWGKNGYQFIFFSRLTLLEMYFYTLLPDFYFCTCNNEQFNNNLRVSVLSPCTVKTKEMCNVWQVILIVYIIRKETQNTVWSEPEPLYPNFLGPLTLKHI